MSSKTAKIIQTIAAIVTILAIGVIVYLLVFKASGSGGFSVTNLKLDGDAAPFSSDGRYEIAEAVEDLKIDWNSGKVSLTVDDGETIRVQETAVFPIEEGRALRYNVKEGRLHIIDSSSLRISCGFRENKTLNVILPKSVAENLVRASISTVSGGLVASDLHARETIALETVSGNIEGEALRAERINLNGISGKIRLDDSSAKTVKVESISGSVYLKVEDAKQIDVESISGSVTIVPVGAEAAHINHSKVSGGMNLYGIVEDRNAELQIEVDTVSGNLTIGEP